MIVSVSGTPGTGKTGTARALAESVGWELIELNKLASKKRLYLGYDKGRECRIVDIEGVKKEVEKLRSSGKNLILESHYAHDMPCDVAVILRARPSELRKRLAERGWKTSKIDENVQAEIMEVCKSDATEQGKEVLEIDTTGKAPALVAGEIRKKLKF